MTKLFSVATRGEPVQARPAVYAGRAEHIAALVARKPAPDPEHIAADPPPAAPEPWWRDEQRRIKAEMFGRAVRGEYPTLLAPAEN
ncbi:MAG: hypothetical protein PHI64_22985 [Zoogloea sp.]|uniref:hypothetical protein n=1 Tax=Zoogloea sp. TaxID=49181 RepID=UPI00260B98E3|nr:hypothetical protein [Zoogloea sp.]MDD2991807.1 hypothetical protein [Zoogloea sp.]